MKKFYRFFASMLLVGLLAACGNEDKDPHVNEPIELTISAAASLQDALEELKTTYEKEHNTIKILYNFGGSGALQQQILQGAPADLFFSAAEDKFDALVKNEIIDPQLGMDLLANELVLIVPKNNEKQIQSFEDLKQAGKIALGTPETVPAGQYGVETLKNSQLWESLESKIVYTKDVRQVLTYSETENVDAGIVYKTDALVSTKVEVVATADERTHTPIIYPVGVIKNSKYVQEAEDFYHFLQSDEAMDVFKKYGFKGAQ
ncbi:Molybdate-binding periplasmic protein precursor [Lysinibacillus sphaericus C3-41]|uniref:Molybdate-binding periplasmic protein n=1 Tax=Lysinibacillus sphaericus (strain C3-41) TaxID=444177 RepID=B1HQS4_LYSSC|nr:molybdate ABC transporter substrate-binding protein [Lysinibacillus sphaericus]ACA40811.1 Molybdate-binding periplasmic protein precursor [Lysinibacillus sphaericus C3-41]